DYVLDVSEHVSATAAGVQHALVAKFVACQRRDPLPEELLGLVFVALHVGPLPRPFLFALLRHRSSPMITPPYRLGAASFRREQLASYEFRNRPCSAATAADRPR